MWLDSLKRMKAASGKTTSEIAVGSGIPEPTLEKLFAGATKDPKLPTMQKLVYYLGYTLEDLYKNENTSTSSENDTEALRMDKVVEAFVQVGIVPKGKALSDEDLRFLEAMIAAIRQWFSE